MMNRTLAKLRARLGGYFWLPCPVCGEPFAGFETGERSLMETANTGKCVCPKPDCQSTARKSAEQFGVRWDT